MYMPNINVMHVVLSLDTGGLEKFVIDLCRHCRPEVAGQIAAIEKLGGLAEKCPDIRIACLCKGDGFSIRAIWDLYRIIRSNKVDIVHSHNTGALFYAGLASKVARKPILHTKHGSDQYSTRMKVTLLSARFPNLVVSVSEQITKNCIEIEGIRSSRIVEIANGVDTDLYRPTPIKEDMRKKLGISKAQFLIGNVARLSPEKDHFTLLDAFKEVQKKIVDPHLIICGAGPLLSKLQQYSRSIEVSHSVSFLGDRDDVPMLMPLFDVFVLTSTSEGTPLTILEAMACGVPVVATSVGGIGKVIKNGYNGLLCEPGNASGVGQNILKIYNDIENSAEIGRKGRQSVTEKYSIRKTASEYISLYRSLAR